MELPEKYRYLERENHPRILLHALNLMGTVEAPGPANNPIIMGWAEEIGVTQDYINDAVPWCGCFLGVCSVRSKLGLPDAPLWAKSWATWGMGVKNPMLGDVVVFERQGGGGHVGIYVGEDDECFHVLGGNQDDSVCIKRIAKNRLFAARRTLWSNEQPDNIRRIHLNGYGSTSLDEG